MLAFLKKIFIPGIYYSGFFGVLITVFKRAELGFLLMVALIPQPNITYKFYDFPIGKDFLDVIFFAALLGVFINKRGLAKTSSSGPIFIFLALTYFALWNSSLRFSLPLPLTTDNPLLENWKNFAVMVSMYYLAANTVETDKQQKVVVILMSLVVLFISMRSFRAFTAGTSFVDDSRYAGPFWIVNLGSNHFGAFIAEYAPVFLALMFFEKHLLIKGLFLATYVVSLHPLFFSYSRGAYLAAFASVICFGVLKKRLLLIIPLIVFFAWQTILPPSVVDRISMTTDASGQLEDSAAARIELWHAAVDLFSESPIFGVGFDGFKLSHVGGRWADTHNYFVKKLCEEGLLGLASLVGIILLAFYSGWILFLSGGSQFRRGLGLGFLACTIGVVLTNLFGDRFSYFELGSYFWILWGLVDRGRLNSCPASGHSRKFERRA
jgi:O-antigen ligase